MPSAMAQTVIRMVLARPDRIAGAVKNWPTTGQAIWPAAKACTIAARASRISAAATQRP